MFAQQADITQFDSADLSLVERTLEPPEPPRPECVADPSAPEDDMATARGFGLGLLLGVVCLALVAGALWWSV